MNAAKWQGQRVLVTGHTGFKGSWLSMLLAQLGAEVHGLALEPSTDPNLFGVADVQQDLASDLRIDIRDAPDVRQALGQLEPTVVFHLAAQPLVRESYSTPLETFDTNVMGVANVLDAVRSVPSVRAIVVVTTDKVYRNFEDGHAFREDEPLGGHDPYSASKAAAELVAESYRLSFFPPSRGTAISTARAGNVVGGGDWSIDRLVPDCIRGLVRGDPIVLRAPDAVRPWQHVLDPLAGYVLLAEHLLREDGSQFATAWNFGPDPSDIETVGHVADRVTRLWADQSKVDLANSVPDVHEAHLLSLDSSRAEADLGWTPRWGIDTSLELTVEWYRAWDRGDDMRAFSLQQLARFAGVRNG